MNSRQRVEAALNHQQPDCVPLDLGASPVTGMHVSSVYQLRQALKLDGPGTPVKVVEPYQMLGEIAPDLMDALGVDVVGLAGPRGLFGFENKDWKPWTLFDGTPVLVPGGFNTEPQPNGDVLMYPEGDRSAPPSGRMPKGGYYFDTIVRQEPIDEANLNVEDNLQEFGPISEADLDHFAREARRLQSQSDRAILATFGGTAFGDIALVPAPWLKYPKGIRDVEEWYVSTAIRFDYVYEVFQRQCEIGLRNLAKLNEAVGGAVTAVFVTGTDFGTQNGPFISPQTYRKLYQPFHRRVNDWIHEHTPWKSFCHSCGSVAALLPDLCDAGFDILNPVQCSAAGMEARTLKDRFGERISFWGGGVNTQRTLPFGTPEEVRREVQERIAIFGRGGGFVFNTVHNVQANTPAENLLALYAAVRETRP
ncbi:MAG TPA: uroporphyrinogen decarboxylase family protein [Thermoguttaceae bacterium]|nr:uroporphyrinogen decarboxylase family protein [Thermoguttaceae bacterium]